ncbi:MAG: hypothetical protein V4613_14675 [Bacteroidota bacterium]
MKVKNKLIFLVFFCTILNVAAQNDRRAERDSLNKLPFHKRLTYTIGGGIGFGTFTNITLSPQIGYRITPRLTAGLGANYQYTRFDRINPPLQIYGGNSFVRLMPHPQLFIQAEYQLLNYKYLTPVGWNDYALIGAGYLPGNGFFIAGYYILKSPINNNVYSEPFTIRAGFMF